MNQAHDPATPDSDPADNQSSPASSASDSQSPCPICRTPVSTTSETFPFCSARCRTIDLGKWISGDYKISRPIEEADLDQED